MRKVLNWKQIRRSSEKELEKEIRKIANAYASRVSIGEHIKDGKNLILILFI